MRCLKAFVYVLYIYCTFSVKLFKLNGPVFLVYTINILSSGIKMAEKYRFPLIPLLLIVLFYIGYSYAYKYSAMLLLKSLSSNSHAQGSH